MYEGEASNYNQVETLITHHAKQRSLKYNIPDECNRLRNYVIDYSSVQDTPGALVIDYRSI